LWEISAASASAPTVFPSYKLKPINKAKFGNWVFPYIDGVISVNNPALAALNLAIRINQSSVYTSIKQKSNLDKIRQLEDIAILSNGTGQIGEPYVYDQTKT